MAAGVLNGVEITRPVTPIRDHLLVKPNKVGETTIGGIALAEETQVKTKSLQGEVVAVGDSWVHPDSGVAKELPIAEGDVVVYAEETGTTVQYNGEEHILLSYSTDVLANFPAGVVSMGSVVPVLDLVIVKQAPVELATTSGLLIASSDDTEKPAFGEVLAVGGGRWFANGDLEPMDVDVGDNVMFDQDIGEYMRLDDKDYLVIGALDLKAKW